MTTPPSASLAELQARIEDVLDAALQSAATPNILQESLRHSTLGGGKRIRAMLVYASGIATGAPLERLDSVAAALECIHAYSLIHDDLPAMDDDDLRRGKPTNHIAFGEDTAILAGDALQTLAFELINNPESGLTDAQCRQISHSLAQAAGRNGMVGGQFLDMQATGKSLTQTELEAIHRGKTGALINAATLCGAFSADQQNEININALSDYSNNLGLAFQVIDDVLDVEASTETLGKQAGADAALGKSTYPELLGLQESKNLAQKLYQQAIASLSVIGDNTELLVELAALIVRRQF